MGSHSRGDRLLLGGHPLAAHRRSDQRHSTPDPGLKVSCQREGRCLLRANIWHSSVPIQHREVWGDFPKGRTQKGQVARHSYTTGFTAKRRQHGGRAQVGRALGKSQTAASTWCPSLHEVRRPMSTGWWDWRPMSTGWWDWDVLLEPASPTASSDRCTGRVPGSGRVLPGVTHRGRAELAAERSRPNPSAALHSGVLSCWVYGKWVVATDKRDRRIKDDIWTFLVVQWLGLPSSSGGVG